MLEAGSQIGSYEIVREIGRGGMGVVHLAHDTKLDRDVAIKALPDDVAGDADRLARFQREAKLLASLHHSNIAAVYGLEECEGKSYLILEYVDGEDLSKRVRRGPLPVDEALEIARQIAEALEAAHEKGIIHRDLKPGNIRLTADGQVKVLDFGLAKALSEGGSSISEMAGQPTMTADESPTIPGAILGTAGYMSPEQARGKAVDRRSDIFSFVCVLYEMLTGRRTFPGENATDTIGATLHAEPSWDALSPKTPQAIRVLMRRCLAKDCNRRLQSIADARIELQECIESGGEMLLPTEGAAPRARSVLIPWVLVGVLAVALLYAVTRPRDTAPSDSPMKASPAARDEVTFPAGIEFGWRRTSSLLSNVGYSRLIAVSPDGTQIVYSGQQEHEAQLYLKARGAYESLPIRGTQNARSPFFSPDGSMIGFLDGDTVRKVRLPGGAPVPICRVQSLSFDAAWLRDGTIVFSSDSGLWRVSDQGGDAEPLTAPDLEAGERGHCFPHAYPDGNSILFTIATDRGMHAALLSQEDRTWKIIRRNAADARYVKSGHLVFARGSEILAAAHDPAYPSARAEAVPIERDAHTAAGMGGVVVTHFATSDTGLVAFPPRAPQPENDALVWVDVQGNEMKEIFSGPGYWMHPRLSPDGDRILFDIRTNDGMCDLHIYDIERGQNNRLTFNGSSFDSEWSPDGTMIAHCAGDRYGRAIFVRAADGTGTPKMILESRVGDYPHLSDWLDDGTTLMYFDNYADGIWITNADGTGEARRILNSPQNDRWGMVSPDGTLITYVLDVSGRIEVFVQRYPGLGPRHRVSIDGGREPLWGPDSRTLYFRCSGTMYQATIETDPELNSSEPKALFDVDDRYDAAESGHQHFDVDRDEPRFLMVRHGQWYRPNTTTLKMLKSEGVVGR